MDQAVDGAMVTMHHTAIRRCQLACVDARGPSIVRATTCALHSGAGVHCLFLHDDAEASIQVRHARPGIARPLCTTDTTPRVENRHHGSTVLHERVVGLRLLLGYMTLSSQPCSAHHTQRAQF